MEIKRYYYQEAMRRIAEEEKQYDGDKIIHMLDVIDAYRKKHPTIPNKEKEKWFEGLVEPVLHFAKVCDLDVTTQITDERFGIIRFESCYFEISRTETAEIRTFWMYLCYMGELRIMQSPEVFIIEFIFILFDDPE